MIPQGGNEIRKKSQAQKPNLPRQLGSLFHIWHSGFFRHLEFVIRHLPSVSTHYSVANKFSKYSRFLRALAVTASIVSPRAQHSTITGPLKPAFFISVNT